jgi:hypothetical protein
MADTKLFLLIFVVINSFSKDGGIQGVVFGLLFL